MKKLSSRQTYLTKYFLTAVWVHGACWTAIVPFSKFGQIEGFFIVPFLLLAALVAYLPMSISFDETKVIVSDWFTKREYRFDEIVSMGYSKQAFRLHPYAQLELLMLDSQVRKIKFIPRSADVIKSLFSKRYCGRQRELLDVWDAYHEKRTSKP